MLARRVQRCSLVDGGNSPGTMKGPMVPPSNRIVRCGACVRWASVAANSGTPTPANTICPSFSSRPAITANSPDAVYVEAGAPWLVIVDAPSAPARVKHLPHSELGKIVGPGFGLVIELLQILLAALHGI